MFRKTGRKTAYIKAAAILSIASLFLSSCGTFTGDESFAVSHNTVTAGEEELSMESSPVLEYSVPRMIPGVLVDRDGYSKNEVKYALVYSEKLPEKYYVYRADNGEQVYIGTPEEITFDEETGKYTAKLIFENIDEDGDYFIFADNLGSSFSFGISETCYQDIYWNLIADECDRISQGGTDLWETYCVLYSYERYKDVLYALKEDAPDVLSSVGEWISRTDFDALSGADACIGTAILFKFGYNYRSLDENMSKECIQKAAAMCKDISDAIKAAGSETLVSDERNAYFLALAEGYRTTATGSYSTEIVSMYDYLTAGRSMYDSVYVLYGAMGYMTTKYKVDRKFCDAMMENLLFKCRDMNDDRNFLRPDMAEQADVNALLVYAQQFAAMNYILDGYEYNEQILNIEHFLSGRNTDGRVFDISENEPADAVAVYAWLAWLENNGKLDPSAPVVWNYSW